MEIVLALGLIIGGLAAYAWLYSRPVPVLGAFLVFVVPTVAAMWILADAGVNRLVTFVVVAPVFFLVHQTAFVLGSVRTNARVLLGPSRPVSQVHDELGLLVGSMTAEGFALVPDGVVLVGDNQLGVMVHPDGTRIEIIQGPGRPAGFACVTEMAVGPQVASVPWSHGIDDDRLRVPGATLPELLLHHRAEVARRVAAGNSVVPLSAGEALDIVLDSDREEVREMLAAPWRNSLRMAVQQTPLRALAGR